MAIENESILDSISEMVKDQINKKYINSVNSLNNNTSVNDITNDTDA